MKNSGIDWIGMIPDDWKVVKLESVVDILDNQRKPVSAGDRESGEYPYWGAGKIMDYVDNYIFDGEYILLGEDGAPFFDKTRPVAHLVNGKFWANNHIHVLKAKTGVNPTYIVNCLNSVDYKDYIKGAIIPKLNQATMRSIMIPLPPLDQQELIAGYLDEQSRKQSLLKHSDLITQLKNYKTSIISEYVTGKKSLDNKPVAMKDSGIDWIGEIPAHWDVKKLGDLVTFAKSGGTPSSKNDSFYCDNGTPWVAIGDMSNTPEVFDTAKKLTQDGIDDKKLQIFPVGTILYSMYATIGKVAELKIPATVNQAVLAFGLRANMNKNFVINALRGFEPHVYDIASYNTQYNLNQQKVLNIDIPVPPLSEQEAIASKLDAVITEVDSVVANSEKIAAELKAYKSAVITEVITGQKLVPGYDSNIAERESR